MSEAVSPAVRAIIDEMCAHGFFRRRDNGTLEVLPKMDAPEHQAEFEELCQKINDVRPFESGFHGSHRNQFRRERDGDRRK